MQWPTWLQRFTRDDDERRAPTRYLDSSAPPATIVERPRGGRESFIRERDAERLTRGRGGPAGTSPATPQLTSAGRKIKEVIPLDLSIPRSEVELAVAGNIVIFNDSTLGTDRVKLRLAASSGDRSAKQVTLRPGQEVGGEPFRVVLITNAAIAGSTAELWVCEDQPGDPFTYQ